MNNRLQVRMYPGLLMGLMVPLFLARSLAAQTVADEAAQQAEQRKPNDKLHVPMVKSATAKSVTEDGRKLVELQFEVNRPADGAPVIQRLVDVTPEQMKAWQQKYLDEISGTEQVVEDQERQLLIKDKGAAPAEPQTIAADAETRLMKFQGLPKLTAAFEQQLIDRCLMIRHIEVVNDERAEGMGPWSFGYLMQELANESATGIKPVDLVEDWLGHWQKNVLVNGFVVPQRKRGIEQLILNDWPRTADHELDLSKSPFRLLAIILRLDLRSNKVLGSERIDDGGAGEARLVYCAVDKAGQPLAFTVIFEYGINRRNFLEVWEWAWHWYDLRYKDQESEEYRVALEALTHQFTDRDSNVEAPPNRSSLNALRTNEIDLVSKIKPRPPAESVWEVREFRLDDGNEGHLRQVTVKQTPDLNFNGKKVLADFVNSNTPSILALRHSTPTDFPRGSDFLGGSAITPPNVIWQAGAIARKDARHLFSLGTCSGCHAREAFPEVGTPAAPFDNVQGATRQPPHFTHVRPRKKNDVAELSAFLTGRGPDQRPFKLVDPAGQKAADGTPLERPFGDLPVRAHDIYGLARFGAFYEIFREQRSQVH
ncbi:MAG: hypothetical protein SGI77_17225 [Pirellulaceae bacterium]|nr:hypothetical protein [Pirellulaceae bacterium]